MSAEHETKKIRSAMPAIRAKQHKTQFLGMGCFFIILTPQGYIAKPCTAYGESTMEGYFPGAPTPTGTSKESPGGAIIDLLKNYPVEFSTPAEAE